MQTFLPYESFIFSAQCLDRQRLGKQRVECLQLLRAIAGESSGWINHPCTRMWRDYPHALVHYSFTVCIEWQSRGYRDSCLEKIKELSLTHGWNLDEDKYEFPDWLGREEFHASHRSNLLRKLPEYYQQFGWTESNDLPYIWA